MNRPKCRNRYAFHIRIIGRDESETLGSVLRALGKAALDAEQRIIAVAETQDREYVAEVVAEERMLIEDLLGCAFVAAQSCISRIISRLIWLHERLKHDSHFLKTTNGNKPGMIEACSDRVPGTPYTQVHVIDAFANYFKHHEEWRPKWKDARGKSHATIAIIQAVGAAENSADNCRKGLAALGVDHVFEVYTMASILARWHAGLADAYRNEVGSLGQL